MMRIVSERTKPAASGFTGKGCGGGGIYGFVIANGAKYSYSIVMWTKRVTAFRTGRCLRIVSRRNRAPLQIRPVTAAQARQFRIAGNAARALRGD